MSGFHHDQRWPQEAQGNYVKGQGFRIPTAQALVLCLPTTTFMDLVKSFNLSKHKSPHLKNEENKVYFVELQRQARIHVCSVFSGGR